MRVLIFALTFVVLCVSTITAVADVKTEKKDLDRRELIAKVTAAGVPAAGFQKILDFMDKNMGKDFIQDTYQCSNMPAESQKTCDDKLRYPTARKITLHEQNYVVYVDFTKPSTYKRMFMINMKTGAVENFLAAHGKGSGVNSIPWKFSNTKDSKQTSLGMYLTGDTYVGHYGLILRLYGLEKSNDQAYNRDIVLHGAPYATESFINSIESATKAAYGRLGVSWGCPAVAPTIAKRIIPLLKGGSLIYHDHKDLAEEALNGRPVVGKEPPPMPKPIPMPRPRPKDAPKPTPSTPTAPAEPQKSEPTTATPPSAPGQESQTPAGQDSAANPEDDSN